MTFLRKVGEGIASLFTLVAAFYDSQPGDIIVIDEPELSLHPTFQRRLSRVIADYARTRQIVLSTHSPYMIDEAAIRNGAELCRTWDRENGTEIWQLNAEAKAAWAALTNTNLNNPHQFGLNAKEVFFLDDGIIVVEGQEDVVLLPRACEILGIELYAEFFGWGAGGAGNIKHICAILESLGYKLVVGLFDSDKTQDMEAARARYPGYFMSCIPAPDIRAKPPVTRPAKEGLLVSSDKVAPHYEEAARSLFRDVQGYLRPVTGSARETVLESGLPPAATESVFVRVAPNLTVGYQKTDTSQP